MDMDKFYDWEHMSVSHIIWLMIKWFNYDNVEMNTSYRKEVESGAWITLKIVKDGHSMRFIDGQRPDIVRKRLIEYLDTQDIRKDFKPKTDEDE